MKKAPLIYDKAMHEARNYWRDKLESISLDSRIPLDHPRPKDGQRQIAAIEFEISPEIDELLQRLTTGNQFLLYTTLVLALKICLSKYTGESTVTIFSSATSNGSISNLLPICGTFDKNSSFKEALLAIKELLTSANRHQQYPFSRMLIDLPDDRRSDHLSLVASNVRLNDEIPDLTADVLVGFETKGKLTAEFRFDNRIYKESTIEGFFRSFCAILEQGLSDMAVRLADIDPNRSGISNGRRKSVSTASGTSAEIGEAIEGAVIHKLFEAAAAKNPANMAVVESERTTTYKALDELADQLAKRLSELSLDLEKPVVILMDAGTEMIVSMLAVMKIGGAFAPIKLLSIKHPIAEILALIESECILCQEDHLPDLRQIQESLKGIEHLITVEYPVSAGNGASPLEIKRNLTITPADAAAVDQVPHEIGSEKRFAGKAGKLKAAPESAAKIPKDKAAGSGKGDGRFATACVVVDAGGEKLSKSFVTHAELAGAFGWLNSRCGITSSDRCFLSPGLGASEQLYDTLGMLIAGASVEIADSLSAKSTAELAESLMSGQITVWDLPTPLMQNLLADILVIRSKQKGARGPRNILLDGEKQCPGLVEALSGCFPKSAVIGLYSSPLAGIWTTFFPFGQDSKVADRPVFAEAIPGFELSVSNTNGEPAPYGITGDLYLRRLLSGQASESRATGLRAKAFDGGGIRWLRGADRCFVKFGCCVELTAIESILCQNEHISAAEVINLNGQGSDDSPVVAFVIAKPDRISAEAARDYLIINENVDLIPDRFIFLDEFPLTTEGEIDRNRLIGEFAVLHDPSQDAADGEVKEIQDKLKVIWLETLQLEDVDEDESFFAQGGNSLKATLLIARIRDEFSVELSVQNFFRKPTVRAVAQLIGAESGNVGTRQKGPEFKAVSREKYRVKLSDSEG